MLGLCPLDEGPARVVLEFLSPEVDGGRFPIKRTVGEQVEVETDAFCDGHDLITVVLRWRRRDEETWHETPMAPLGNDRWGASFTVTSAGRYRYTAGAWIDRFGTWRDGLTKKVRAAQDVRIDLLSGAGLAEDAAARASGQSRRLLSGFASRMREESDDALEAAFDPELAELMRTFGDRRFGSDHPRELEVVVDRERARFSAWYEMFPRSASPVPGRHGTLRDVEARLDYVESMGFDVLYLPPVHPIGITNRKGRNNATAAAPGEPGSPWAIGSPDGGHDAIHPDLGTMDDFDHLVEAARARGIEVALDLAFQCSPDHPYVTKHGEWFKQRPDGSVQFAENPPKRYEDIYPLDFETPSRRELWDELLHVVLHWVSHGVRIFRVDNPHTKPFAFWEWLIGEVKERHPDVLFLSEAFTRPKVMYRLAKLGFTQSYTYFAWRNTKEELTGYVTELTETEVKEYFRPNFWPNTPDILNAALQDGGPPAFVARLVLAATLVPSFGIYGPPFELCEARPREPGSEEYLNSEKYEIRHWDLDRPGTLAPLVGAVNRIRRQHPALQLANNVVFHPIGNDQLIAYSRATEDASDAILVVVSLDTHWPQSGWTDLDLGELKIAPDEEFAVHDLIDGSVYHWSTGRNFVRLEPAMPAHVFEIRSQLRSEQEYEYF